MFIRLMLFALVACCWGCGDGDELAPTAPTEEVLRPSGELQPYDLSSIISVDSVRAMPAGTPLFMRTEFANGELADLEMTFVRVVDDLLPPMPLYMVEASDPILIQLGGVAKGMSGSPIFTEQGTLGAIAYGWDGQDSPPYYFFATPIEWVIGTQGALPLAKRAATWQGHRIVPLEIPLLGTGFANAPGASGLDVVAAGATQQPQESFAPGRPLAIGFLLGEITIAGRGTVSHVDGERVYGFGHSLYGRGAVALPIIGAQVIGQVSNWASPVGFATLNSTVRGTLTQDRRSGVRGILDAGPTLLPIESTYVLPSGRVLERTHQLAPGSLASHELASLVNAAFFAPLLNQVDDDPNHSLRVAAHISFVGTDSVLVRSRLYADREGGLLFLVNNAIYDWDMVLQQLLGNPAWGLQLQKPEVRIELVPESLFASVTAIAADAVVTAGSTLTVATSLRVGQETRQVEMALDLADAPPGTYRLEVGSLATLGESAWGAGPMDDPFYADDEPTLADFFARENGPDENATLKARLQLVSPADDFLSNLLSDGLFNNPAARGADLPFGGDAISEQQAVDLYLSGRQSLNVEVVEN
jgi:hypothetical protein